MELLTISSSNNNHHHPSHIHQAVIVLLTSFTEEGVEGVVSSTDGLIRRHLAIRLDAMLQAVQLPASITDLDTGLNKQRNHWQQLTTDEGSVGDK